MRPIQMVDLKTQYRKISDEVNAAISSVLESGAFINGKEVRQFADNLAQYLGVKHVIPCANGTDALQLALMALDLQPGDEVITPSFTFIATTEVVALLGLKPVFVDVDARTFCLDTDALRKAITTRTRAIVPVHLYGQAANMEEIMSIAREYELTVIEDNAQAIGGDYFFRDGSVKKTGTIGHAGTISFFPSKNLGAYGDAGAICTNDDSLALKLTMLANHGQSKRYYHDIVGCNSRLDTLQAAILNVKLPRLDGYIDARRAVADYYDAAFAANPHLIVPFRTGYCRHVYHQYTLILENTDRDALQQYLASKEIPSMIYYPVPGHRQKMFHSFGSEEFHLPVTDWLSERVISLPIHTELDQEQLTYITEAVLEFVNR